MSVDQVTATGPFHTAGAVPLADGCYVVREFDRDYVEGLRDRARGPIHLHGSRQSGKTSLLIRAQQQLEDDHAVSFLDLASTSPDAWPDIHDFCCMLVRRVARELGQEPDQWGELARHEGLMMGLAEVCRAVDRPVVLLFDELDELPSQYRHELIRALRALHQEQARDSRLRVNSSLCGVRPPLGFFTGPDQDAEAGGQRQIWLDDFDPTPQVAEVFGKALSARAGLSLPLSTTIALALVRYAAGYPQACTWLANLVARKFNEGPEKREQILDIAEDHERFTAFLRSEAAAYFDPTARRPSHVRQQMNNDTAWVRVNEKFFVDAGPVARATLSTLELVLDVVRKNATPIVYEDGNPHHELLRMSGLARLDDGKLLVRCPLFADAFDAAWLARMRRQIGSARRFGGRERSRLEKKLLIIGTGGTIGMAENPKGRVTSEQQAAWYRAVEELVDVEWMPLYNLDSANVGPQEWTGIAQTIINSQDEFDGVVVAHGTDTMAYSASAIAFALGPDLSFPVVFTGSTTTVDVLHGDVIPNVLRAALVASTELPEVVIAFGEKIFRATRAQKKDDLRFDAFESPGYPELGFVAEDVQIFEQTTRANPQRSIINRPTGFASGILNISQMPGSESAFYRAALDAVEDERLLCRAIVIQSLGAGNVPTRGAADLTTVIREARDRLIPVVLTSQYPVLPANYLRYSPSAAAIEAGAIPTGNMTMPAVVAKLSWVIQQVDQQIREGATANERQVERVAELMGREVVGEGGSTVMLDPSDNDDAPSERLKR